MIEFDKLPKASTLDALRFWLDKQEEYKKSAEFLMFDESGQRKKYLDIIPFVQTAIEALATLRSIEMKRERNVR